MKRTRCTGESTNMQRRSLYVYPWSSRITLSRYSVTMRKMFVRISVRHLYKFGYGILTLWRRVSLVAVIWAITAQNCNGHGSVHITWMIEAHCLPSGLFQYTFVSILFRFISYGICTNSFHELRYFASMLRHLGQMDAVHRYILFIEQRAKYAHFAHDMYFIATLTLSTLPWNTWLNTSQCEPPPIHKSMWAPPPRIVTCHMARSECEDYPGVLTQANLRRDVPRGINHSECGAF